MSYVPHTEEEKRRMLGALGLDTIDELFDPIPADLQFRQRLNVPAPAPELELRRHFRELADRNEDASRRACFLGAGLYDHYVPSVVGTVIGRSEFYTAYTPYQPEMSQGTLQAIYEFQSLVAHLMGMEVANASMYDGASALAEAVLMATDLTGRSQVLLPGTVHPAWRRVTETYLAALGMHLVNPDSQRGVTQPSALAACLTEQTACVVIQQ